MNDKEISKIIRKKFNFADKNQNFVLDQIRISPDSTLKISYYYKNTLFSGIINLSERFETWHFGQISTRGQSKFNTPVNICVGTLIVKELFQVSDDDIVESMMLDVRYQYALHTTSYEEQPSSEVKFP